MVLGVGQPPSKQIWRTLVLACLYVLGSVAAWLFVVNTNALPIIWLPGGLLLSALLIYTRRSWPWLLLVACSADLALGLLAGMPPTATLSAALTHCAGPALAAWLISRRRAQAPALQHLRDITALAGWSALGCAFAAGLGSAAFAYITPPARAWISWWLADSLGILLVAPIVLTWASRREAPIWKREPQWLEELLLFSGALAGALFIFSTPPTTFRFSYFVFPFLIWAAVRLGPRQTAETALAIALVVLWNTAQGRGPFSILERSSGQQLIAAQSFLIITTLSALLLATSTTERQLSQLALKQAQQALRQANELLEQRVAERTAALTTTNQRLQRAETFLSAVLQQMPLGILIAEAPTGRLLIHNSEAERLLGHAIHNQLNPLMHGAFGALHPSGQPYTPDEYPLARALQHHETINQEDLLYQHGDGTITSITINAAPIRDANGNVIAAVSTFYDITTRAEAERALRESEERFAKTFYSSPIAMVISTVGTGHILEINDRFLQLFGRERAEVLGQSSVLIDMWFNPADRADAIALLRQHGQVRDFEVIVRAASGLPRSVLLSADILHLSNQQCMITTIYDISERKQAELALQESRQQIQDILDHAPALISLKQLDGHYLLVNRQLVSLLNREPAAIIGRTDADLFSPEFAAAIHAAEQQLLTSGAPIELEERIPHGDDLHMYRSIKFPLNDLQGQPYALGTISTDITQQKRLEAQLFQAQKMESIGQFAGGIAHDFNNLLTAIAGYADLSMETLAPGSPARDDILEITRAASRASTLVRQLLAFARRQPIESQVIDLNTLISNLDKLMRRLLSEDITLAIRLAAELHRIKADPGQIEQVVLNLVINARDAMPNGGQLTISTANMTLDQHAAPRQPTVSAEYALLVVSDTGVGMTPEVQSRVFEPFFTTKQPGQGTGLGLSTCYGIVQQHGGQIWLDSAPGQGTTVSIYLPQASDTPTHLPDPGDERLAPGSETVLVVEDEAIVRALAVRILRMCGYTVLEAPNGLEGLRVARAYQPATIHLLLTDIVMPHMSGQATAEQMRTLYPELKVMFMSGYTEHPSLESTSIDIQYRLLQKPFSPVALARAIRSTLDA